ncbi:MAG TPA: methyltransferase domain-containing protein [Kineosporiaceae bacterium]|nr:methyltransferase domain-containing protein [Kineosporiaceae bacterium]
MNFLSWNHNTYYQPLLLRELPPRCERILDVGCGTGEFAVQLAEQAEHVDALDRSPEMIRAARARVPANVTCIEADLLRRRVPLEHYDAITSISALHHLVLAEALPRLSAALRPGGVLVATALPRTDLPRELPLELAAVVMHNVRGLVLAGARAIHGESVPVDAAAGQMPIAEPRLTTREVRREAAAALPGSRVRRLLFWRYLLVWHKKA